MPICAVVFKERGPADMLDEQLVQTATPLRRCELVPPSKIPPGSFIPSAGPATDNKKSRIKTLQIDKVPFLNPKLARQQRQKAMSIWLMPFGFLAGLTFTQMTGLSTFSNLGLEIQPWGESLIGSLLGMFSGLLGSYVATASVNSDNADDINVLRKRNEEGLWLLLLETPIGIELPWQILKSAQPEEIMRFSDP